MNVLFVCHRFPYPPKRGGKIRPFNVIKHLSSQGHRVTVASLARSASELSEGAGLRAFCKEYLVETISPLAAGIRMLARLPSLTPSSMGYFYSPRLQRRIRAKLESEDFDLIFVHCSSVAPYVANVKGLPKVFDIGDVDSRKWLGYSRARRPPWSLGYRLEGVKLERAERQLARHFDLVTCTTRSELETFREFGTGVASGWFPNGVDSKYFAPSTEKYDPNRICFVGRMDYYPNQQAMLHFCAKVFPAIRARRPEASLVIVGANPSRRIERLVNLAGVSVTGTVSDVRPFVRKAAVSVAPLALARGTQNKVLECMAMGIPVVASKTAAAGVDVVPGEHVLVATTPEEYRESVLAVLENPDKRGALAHAARERVLSKHSWSSAMERLDQLLSSSHLLRST